MTPGRHPVDQRSADADHGRPAGAGRQHDDRVPALAVSAGGPDDAGRLTLRVDGELDHATVPVLREHLFPALAAPGTGAVLVDLSAVSFLNAGGLAALAEARERADAAGVRLALRCGHQRAVLRPLQITGLLELFDLDPAPLPTPRSSS